MRLKDREFLLRTLLFVLIQLQKNRKHSTLIYSVDKAKALLSPSFERKEKWQTKPHVRKPKSIECAFGTVLKTVRTKKASSAHYVWLWAYYCSQVDASFRHGWTCSHLVWSPTCVDFGRAQIPTQVDVSFSPFGHPTQVDTNWSQVNCISVKFTTFCDLRELARRLANQFGRPSQVRAQVLVLQTCVDLHRPATPPDQNVVSEDWVKTEWGLSEDWVRTEWGLSED